MRAYVLRVSEIKTAAGKDEMSKVQKKELLQSNRVTVKLIFFICLVDILSTRYKSTCTLCMHHPACRLMP